MAEEVYLDVPAVTNVAKTLGEVSQVLATVNKVMEALSMTLKTTAMMGLIGGAVVAQFIDSISPFVQNMSEKLEEINQDVMTAVRNFENADNSAMGRFG